MQTELQATCKLHSWSYLGHFTFTPNEELTFMVHISKINPFFFFFSEKLAFHMLLCVYTLLYALNSSIHETATRNKNTIFQNIMAKITKTML